MNDLIVQMLKDYPYLVWVWLGASVAAIGLRSAWDVSEERPRVVRFILAVVDVLQLNFSGPIKLVSNQIKGKTQ